MGAMMHSCRRGDGGLGCTPVAVVMGAAMCPASCSLSDYGFRKTVPGDHMSLIGQSTGSTQSQKPLRCGSRIVMRVNPAGPSWAKPGRTGLRDGGPKSLPGGGVSQWEEPLQGRSLSGGGVSQ